VATGALTMIWKPPRTWMQSNGSCGDVSTGQILQRSLLRTTQSACLHVAMINAKGGTARLSWVAGKLGLHGLLSDVLLAAALRTCALSAWGTQIICAPCSGLSTTSSPAKCWLQRCTYVATCISRSSAACVSIGDSGCNVSDSLHCSRHPAFAFHKGLGLPSDIAHC